MKWFPWIVVQLAALIGIAVVANSAVNSDVADALATVVLCIVGGILGWRTGKAVLK